jgi:carbamate kinase
VRIVVALGGNALLRRGQPLDADVQLANVKQAAASIAALCAEHDVVVTHGNGPQVGLLALQNEAYGDVRPYPLDVLDAESEGMIGYLLEQELANELPGREVVTLLTRVEVDAGDPAFAAPAKPVGPVYPPADAAAIRDERGWTLVADGDGFRRAVPSPRPMAVLGLRAIQILLEDAVVVVCAGGGGIPVVRCAGGTRGVEAVVDKDRTAALLAAELGADLLLLLTDVGAVVDGWGTAGAEPISTAGADALDALGLPAGSMGPKVEAAAWFARRGGRAAIGALADAAAIVDGKAGTTVLADGPIVHRSD